MVQQNDTQLIKELEQKSRELEETKQELEQLSRLFNKTQEVAQLGNWELSLETNEATWSDEACRILGILPGEEQPSLEVFLSFVHPEDLDVVKKAIETAEKTRSVMSYTNRIIRRDGVIRYINTEGKFEFDKYGKPVSLYGIIHDITEKKLVEDSLHQSEANLRLIIDIVPHAIFAKDHEGRFIFANKAFADFYARGLEQAIHKRIEDIIPVKEEAQKFIDTDREVLETAKPVFIEAAPFTDREGNMHLFQINKMPFTPTGTNEKGILSIAVEITEMKKTEEKLRQSEANLRLIMNVVPHSIFSKDQAGRFLFANAAFGELYGMDPDELIGKRMVDLIPEKGDAGKFLKEDKYILESGKASVLSAVTFTDSKGNVRIFQTNKMPFTPTGTNEKGILSIAVEITEMKKAEEKLKNSEAALLTLNAELEERVKLRTAELLEANKELEAFSYTVSHDLRTPVRAMQMFSSLLKKQFKDSADADTLDYLDHILRGSVEMNNLINDLLEFSRLGRQELEKDKVNMQLIVQGIATHLKSIEANKEIEIEVSPLYSVSADQKVIKSVWQNLLENAAKFSKKDEMNRIQVSSKKQNDMIIYAVKDNGVGFDMKRYDNLFKPFSRLHAASEYKGTGAGLAICDRIVKKHGGKIWAESVLNEGSTFYFSLPAEDA